MRRQTNALAAAGVLFCAMLGLSACRVQPPVAADALWPQALDASPLPLANMRASVAAGRQIFADRATGNCLLCHRITGLDAPFQGNVGPDLTLVGQRLSPAQLRFRIVDAARLNPATIMPPYYRTAGLRQVAQEYRGRTVLSAEQVEHLVAYLASLQAPAS